MLQKLLNGKNRTRSEREREPGSGTHKNETLEKMMRKDISVRKKDKENGRSRKKNKGIKEKKRRAAEKERP